MPTIRVDKLPNFYTRVYDFVQSIPRGYVVTYGQIAVLLGSPRAARAVGYALRGLPSDSDVPCWRVINSRGETSIQRRSVVAADLQCALLEHEEVNFKKGRVDLKIFQWWPE